MKFSTLTGIILCAILVVMAGCDFMKCGINGKLDKDGNPTYIGFKCGGDW